MSQLSGFYVVRQGEVISGPHVTREEALRIKALTGADTIEEVNDETTEQAGSAAATPVNGGEGTTPGSTQGATGVPASDEPSIPDGSSTNADTVDA